MDATETRANPKEMTEASFRSMPVAYVWLLAITHALLFVAAFPPWSIWPLIFLAPVPLVAVALWARSTASALIAVGIVQTGLWLWISRWLWQITEAGLVPYAMAMALWSVAMVWLLRRVMRHPRLGRVSFAVTVPIIWTGMEFFRGELLFDGYPWFLLAHPVVEWPVFVQSADLFGTYFISFLIAMTAGGVVDTVRMYCDEDARSTVRARVPVVAAAAIMLGINLGYGTFQLRQTAPLLPGPSLLVIQTNLPQDNKMRSTGEQQWENFQSFLALTVDSHDRAVAAGQRVDLIVWPETMVFGWGFEPETLHFFLENAYWQGYRFALATEVAAGELGVPMLVGSPAVLGVRVQGEHLEWDANYNSAYLIDPQLPEDMHGSGEYQRYDKVFLTPFGETMPYIRAWPWLQEKMLSVGARGMQFNLQPGTEPRVLSMQWNERTISLATPICFEATMSRVCRSITYLAGEKRANVMINLTNDGWFGSHDPGRVQHAQIARLRAIENRVPVVRSANTGMSVHIDSSGRLVESVGEGRYGVAQQAGSMLAHVQLDSRTTLFGRIGDAWGWMCMVLAVVAIPAVLWMK